MSIPHHHQSPLDFSKKILENTLDVYFSFPMQKNEIVILTVGLIFAVLVGALTFYLQKMPSATETPLDNKQERKETKEPPKTPDQPQEETYQTALPQKGDLVAEIATTMGTIKIKLFPADAPKTVENFRLLAEKGYYDGLIFHRVINDFMIQGGDPTGTGMGGESAWGGSFDDEFSPKLQNIRGALSMANSGPNTNGSQFFIVQKQGGTSWLNGKHSVFGQVYEGMDIVDAIAAVDADRNDKPLQDVKMNTVKVFTLE